MKKYRGHLTRSKHNSRIRFFVKVFICAIFAVTFLANIVVIQYYAMVIPAREAEAPVAIILGGGMQEDGTQTRMQEDRVATGIALYNAGRVETLVMSGDDGQNRFNEIEAMKAQAIEAGVAEEDILLDPHAYRTYLSCYRAKHEFGFKKVVLVTQFFHIPRAIYFCDRQGIETTGVIADRGPYTNWQRFRMQVRDVFARVKGVWEAEVTKPSK